jgi:hypothetical protein
LTTAVIEIKKKITKNGKPYARALFKWVDPDTISGEEYKKYHRSAVPVIIDYRENGEPIIVWRRKRYKSILVPLIPAKLEAEYNLLKDAAMAHNRGEIMKQMEYYKKFLGETGLKVQGYTLEDLKNQFLNDDGSINWKLCEVDEQIWDSLAEGHLAQFEEVNNCQIKSKDSQKLMRWLKVMWRKEGHLPAYERLRREREAEKVKKAQIAYKTNSLATKSQLGEQSQKNPETST